MSKDMKIFQWYARFRLSSIRIEKKLEIGSDFLILRVAFRKVETRRHPGARESRPLLLKAGKMPALPVLLRERRHPCLHSPASCRGASEENQPAGCRLEQARCPRSWEDNCGWNTRVRIPHVKSRGDRKEPVFEDDGQGGHLLHSWSNLVGRDLIGSGFRARTRCQSCFIELLVKRPWPCSRHAGGCFWRLNFLSVFTGLWIAGLIRWGRGFLRAGWGIRAIGRRWGRGGRASRRRGRTTRRGSRRNSRGRCRAPWTT